MKKMKMIKKQIILKSKKTLLHIKNNVKQKRGKYNSIYNKLREQKKLEKVSWQTHLV